MVRKVAAETADEWSSDDPADGQAARSRKINAVSCG